MSEFDAGAARIGAVKLGSCNTKAGCQDNVCHVKSVLMLSDISDELKTLKTYRIYSCNYSLQLSNIYQHHVLSPIGLYVTA